MTAFGSGSGVAVRFDNDIDPSDPIQDVAVSSELTELTVWTREFG